MDAFLLEIMGIGITILANEKTEIVISGAKWNNGSNTSPFYRNSNNTPSNRNRNISGSHLVNAQTYPVISTGYYYEMY